MFKDNLFTGVGLDSYLTHFYEYREPGYPTNYGFDITSSNAHNTVIQLFATGGLFVGLSYCVLLAYVLYCGVKLINDVDKQYKGISILLVTTWIGLQSQSIISIDYIVLSIWNWVFAGMIVGLSSMVSAQLKPVSKENPTENLNSKRPAINSVSTSFILPWIISGIFLAPIIVVVVLLGRVEDQTYYSPTFVTSSDKNLVVANGEKIINNPLADPYYKFRVALNIIDAGNLDKGMDIIKSLSQEDPRQIDYLTALLRAEMTRNNLTEAVKLRESIAKLDPWNAQNYFELALLYKSLDKNQQVKKIKEIILEINTSTAYSNQAKLELG